MSAQPIWKFLTNLGDATPLDYGGLFIYRDETGAYPEEMELVEPPSEDQGEGGPYEIRRVCLDRLACTGEIVHPDTDFARADPTRYAEWFSADLASVAATMGRDVADLRRALCSGDVIERAQAYRDVYSHHGWDNGDSDSLHMTRAECEARYTNGEI